MTPAELGAAVRSAVAAAVEAGALSVAVPEQVSVERPRNPDHGDYATNVAMQLAKPAGRPPREVAEAVAARLREVSGVASVDIAGPGFLNIRLDEAAAGELARTIVESGSGYGRTDRLAKQRVNLEFVSANPTGPVHIGGVRWAAVGDSLARLLEASGADVTREYYVNDAGAQIDRFAESLLAAAREQPTPPDGYAGAYVADIAGAIVSRHPEVVTLGDDDALALMRREGLDLMFAEITSSLERFGVAFDVFFRESELHRKGEIAHAVERLRAQGNVFDADGAVWLRTTDHGDDKDRVLVRSDGAPTYFAADCAYYLDKRERGFDRCVYMLGADHHGYIARLRAVAACFGDDPQQTLEVLIGQFVNLVRDGQPVRMSKRAGDVVTLDDLVDAIGVDAGRYALARSSVDSTLDIDIDVWSRRTNDNPVFYVQYAHARTCNVAKNAAAVGITVDRFAPGLLQHPTEAALLGSLGEFPRIVAAAADLREPHRVARYLEALAGSYHRWYDNCRVIPVGDEDVTDVNHTRLWLNDATRTVLANGLALLGVSAPERM